MKSLCSVMLSASVFVWMPTLALEAQEEKEDQLKVLQSQFDELKDDLFSAQTKFDERYLGELKKLEAKAQGEGKLEIVLAIRAEKVSFRTRNPETAAASEYADLARLQKIYDGEKARISAERAVKLAPLVAGYRTQLADLKVERTKAGDIEGALVVHNTIAKLDTDFPPGAASDPPVPATPPTPEEKGIQGKFVRIELPGKDTFLHLAEVEVYVGGENVARKGTATQASTWVEYDYGVAAAAIDGNTDGSLGGNSISHTSMGEDLWWEVDLGEEMDLTKITIWNREDGLGSRLDGFELSVLNKRRKTVWKKSFPTAPRQIETELSEEE